MATIEEEVAAIREAIASGVKVVETRSAGVTKRVEYPAFADLRDRLSFLEGQTDDGTRPRRRRGIVATF